MKTFDLKKSWNLSFALAKAWFKLKNEGSYLGIFWYLLNPLLMFLLLLLVFKPLLGQSIENYPLYLFLGIIMFNFFQQTTQEATRIIYDYRGLIKSIYFPKISLVASVILKSLFVHFFEFLLFAFFGIFLGLKLATVLYYLPIIILLAILTFGISLILATSAIFFRDVENIWIFAVRLLWLATPIFYVLESNSFLAQFILLNPLSVFITLARETMLYANMPNLLLITSAVIYSLTALLIGILIYHTQEKKLAELI